MYKLRYLYVILQNRKKIYKIKLNLLVKRYIAIESLINYLLFEIP